MTKKVCFYVRVWEPVTIKLHLLVYTIETWRYRFYTAMEMSSMDPVFFYVKRRNLHNLIITESKSFVKTFKHENYCHLSNEYKSLISLMHFHRHQSFGLILFNRLKLLWLRKFSKLHQIVKCFIIRMFKILRTTMTNIWLVRRCSWLNKLDIPYALSEYLLIKFVSNI